MGKPMTYKAMGGSPLGRPITCIKRWPANTCSDESVIKRLAQMNLLLRGGLLTCVETHGNTCGGDRALGYIPLTVTVRMFLAVISTHYTYPCTDSKIG